MQGAEGREGRETQGREVNTDFIHHETQYLATSTDIRKEERGIEERRDEEKKRERKREEG